MNNDFPDAGYVYMVCGDPKFLTEAAASAASLKRVDPEAHVTLIADMEPPAEGVNAGVWDHVVLRPFAQRDSTISWSDWTGASRAIAPDEWKHVFTFRARHLYADSPYRLSFFLDTDTYFVESCRELFGLLDYYDLCMAPAPGDSSKVIADGKPLEGYTPFNCGVILFRRTAEVEALFRDWHERYESKIETYAHDQPALMESLLHSPCRVYPLQSVWNARFDFYERLVGKVKLLHGRHRDLAGVAARINADRGIRAWLPFGELCASEQMGLRTTLRLIGALVRRAARIVWWRGSRGRIRAARH